MLATPLRVPHLVAGHLIYVATRVAVAVSIYLIALAAFGALHSFWALCTIPLCVLLGLAFAAPISALSAYAEEDIFNPLFRFIVMPLFLFSGTFFPVTRLPQGLREIAYATPLWHGVDLARGLVLGTAGAAAALGHVAYLLAFVLAGLAVGRITYARRLQR
jgi:lipooligosaccharide transport system permease protein